MAYARLTEVAAPTAGLDAANKNYVDTAAANAPREGWMAVYSNATFNARSANLAGATVQRIAGYPVGVYCFSLPANTGLQEKGAVATVQQLFNMGGQAGIAVVSALYNTVCSQAGYLFSVHTYNSSGTLTDLPFTVLIPR